MVMVVVMGTNEGKSFVRLGGGSSTNNGWSQACVGVQGERRYCCTEAMAFRRIYGRVNRATIQLCTLATGSTEEDRV